MVIVLRSVVLGVSILKLSAKVSRGALLSIYRADLQMTASLRGSHRMSYMIYVNSFVLNLFIVDYLQGRRVEII